MSKENKISYEVAYEELITIVSALEEGDVSVDVLSEKVKRASLLIKICKEKLFETEKDVAEILRELDEKNG